MDYRLDEFFRDHDLTVAQWVAMKTISDHESLCQKELSALIDKNQNTVKALIDRLMDKGFIERRPDEKDRRQMLLFLSPGGRKLVDRISPMEDEINETMVKGLSAEEVEQLKALLLRLEKSMSS